MVQTAAGGRELARPLVAIAVAPDVGIAQDSLALYRHAVASDVEGVEQRTFAVALVSVVGAAGGLGRGVSQRRLAHVEPSFAQP